MNKIHVPATVFGQVGAGEGYKLTLGHFLSLYSTLGDALSQDPCGVAPRAANQNFSAKWEQKRSFKTFNICPKPRDLDQDTNNTTHCANATFLTDAAGNNWRRGGWWHAGDVTVQYLFVICLLFLWPQKLGIFTTYVKGVVTLQYLFVRVQGDPK